MSTNRIDPAALKAAVDHALALYKQGDDLLLPFLLAMSEEERMSTPNPPLAFPQAARQFAEGMSAFPDVAELAEYEAEAVIEDLDNVNQIARLRDHVEFLDRRLGDAKLRWLGEAYSATLNAYSVALGALGIRPALARVIDALRGIFKGGRRKAKPVAEG